MAAVVLITAAYLCGSLPVGVWVGRWIGVDVQQAGSGNIGATNVARTAGARAALLTLLGDVAKGLLPTVLAQQALGSPWLVALTGLAAFFGHIFSVFLCFSGGKGVATGFGVFLCLAPVAALVSLAVFVALALLTRYVSVASIVAAAALAIVTATAGYAVAIQGAAGLTAVVIIVRHRTNLVRLRQGNEPKFRIGRVA